MDNPRALVLKHDPQTREAIFRPTLFAFCKHRGGEPNACAPYRARTKGKPERSVGYIKRNASARGDQGSRGALSGRSGL